MFNIRKSSIFITSAYLCLSLCICSNNTDSFNKSNPLTYKKNDIKINKQSSTNNEFPDTTQKAIISEGGPVFYNSNKFNTISGSALQPTLLSSLKNNQINSSYIVNSTAGNYSTHQPSTSNSDVNNTLWELSNTDYSISTTELNSSDVFVSEENVQKIVPRKGVEQTVVVDSVSTPPSNTYPENSTLMLNKLSSTNISVIPHVKGILKENMSDFSINETEQNNIKSFPTLSRKKSKPLTTLDEFKRNTSSVNANPSTPKKNDYVIPVVAVILAVPLISVLVMFFYKKGTEFWERRHYRRMDFLIDGMYND